MEIVLNHKLHKGLREQNKELMGAVIQQATGMREEHLEKEALKLKNIEKHRIMFQRQKRNCVQSREWLKGCYHILNVC